MDECNVDAAGWQGLMAITSCVVRMLIDKRTWVLCWTLLATIGLMASSRSSFSADAAMTGDEGYPGGSLKRW